MARIVLGTFFLIAIGYGIYEAQGLVYGPEIALTEAVRTSTSSTAYVAGTALRMSELYINGKKVAVTESGAFNELYVLSPGSNHFALEAKDARGRTKKNELTILYTGTATTPLHSEITPVTSIVPSNDTATSTESPEASL